MHSSIAVVGEKESVLGYKAVGFSVFETSSPEEAEKVIRDLCKKQTGIIFVTEKTLAPIAYILGEYKSATLPAIIPIPGIDGPTGLGMTNVKKSVERAVGADILFKD